MNLPSGPESAVEVSLDDLVCPACGVAGCECEPDATPQPLQAECERCAGSGQIEFCPEHGGGICPCVGETDECPDCLGEGYVEAAQ